MVLKLTKLKVLAHEAAGRVEHLLQKRAVASQEEQIVAEVRFVVDALLDRLWVETEPTTVLAPDPAEAELTKTKEGFLFEFVDKYDVQRNRIAELLASPATRNAKVPSEYEFEEMDEVSFFFFYYRKTHNS